MGREIRLFVSQGTSNKANLPFTLSALIILLGFLATVSGWTESRVDAAEYRTANFIAKAKTPELARQVGETAEQFRRELSVLWLGEVLPQWSTPCPIKVKAGPDLGAGGETTFTFLGKEVFGWKMSVQGTEQRILDSVLPHEITHMILASSFRCPVPRWLDEGIATSVESNEERSNYRRMLIDFLKNQRGIPFNTMVRQKEYPADMMPFYSQGFSVCEYLLAMGGHRRLVEFGRKGIATGDWPAAVHEFYGLDGLNELQTVWQAWVSEWYRGGMPSELPQVAKLDDRFERDGRDRSTMEGTSAVWNSVAMNSDAVADINGSFVARPGNVAAGNGRGADFRQGVGTATPNAVAGETLIASNGDAVADGLLVGNGGLVYQGSYGRGEPRETLQASSVPEPFPTAPPIVLGQEPKEKRGLFR